MSFDFVLGFLTGTTLQDAIFIVGAYAIAPFFTLYVIRKHPKFVVLMLRALRKDPEVVKELGLLLGVAWAEGD